MAGFVNVWEKLRKFLQKTFLSRLTSQNATKFGLQHSARAQISYRSSGPLFGTLDVILYDGGQGEAPGGKDATTFLTKISFLSLEPCNFYNILISKSKFY